MDGLRADALSYNCRIELPNDTHCAQLRFLGCKLAEGEWVGEWWDGGWIGEGRVVGWWAGQWVGQWAGQGRELVQ